MAILINTDVDTVKEYRNKTVFAKVANKKQQIVFKINADASSFDEAVAESKANKNVAMIEFQGSADFLNEKELDDSNVYVGVIHNVGSDITEEDIQNVLSWFPSWVTVIFKLPEDYKDIYFLHKMCEKYSRVRFAGGVLFDIDGVRVGCVGFDTLRKMDVKVPKDDLIKYDCIDVIPTERSLEELDLKVVVGKVINTAGRSKSSTPKEKKPKVKINEFDSFLNSNGNVAF